MSDTCYLELTCRKQDEKRFEEPSEAYEGDGIPPGQVQINWHCANLAFGVGWEDEGTLPRDIPYTGSHSAGDNYDAAQFACDGKEFQLIDSNQEDNFVVRTDNNGDPIQEEIDRIKEFVKFRNRVSKLLAETAIVPEPKPGPALPPDPDGKNDDRAEWARCAIETFQGETGTYNEDAVSDLLGDLAHYCDRNGLNLRHELLRASHHYDDETSGEFEDGKQFDGITILTGEQMAEAAHAAELKEELQPQTTEAAIDNHEDIT